MARLYVFAELRLTLQRLSVILALAAGAIVHTSALQSQKSASNPWPPGLQQVPDESPVLSPAEELKKFFLPPGYHAELVASEPMVVDPIAIDWDADGRMWVIEQLAYMPEINPSIEREHEPICRIVVLEDTNGDGKMDKRTVFADGLVLPRALKVLDHGVLVGEPPNLWLMRDTNGDGKADKKDLVTDTYGRRDANVEHNDNSLTWGMDNWLHTSESTVSLRLKNGTFEVQKTLARGQWGNSQDDAGHIYRNSNEQVLFVDLVPTRYYARNANLVRTRGSYESLQGENFENNTVWPVRPTRAVNRGYQAGILRDDGSLAAYTAVCSPTVYRGDRLPAELRGNVFVAEPAGNVVSRLIVSDDGSRIVARKAYERAEFFASTDERFRPVYLSSAPDGTLYVVDLYHGIIQHKGFITEYLRDQYLSRKLEQDIHHGRIWRIVHDSTTRGPKPALSRATLPQLVTTLSHPNGWWRDTAQRLLVERGAKSVAAQLMQLAASAPDHRTRLHALWTLDGDDLTTPSVVLSALRDTSRDVRVAAIRLAERFMPANGEVQAAVARLVDDADWNVQQQLAASMAALPDASRESAIAALLAKQGDDPVVVDAALSGVSGREAAVLTELLKTSTQTAPLEQAITMVAATVVRASQDASVQALLAWIADESRPAWARSAVLRGAEVALTGAAVPGGATGRRGAGPANAGAPCPTCPGGRAGPGGASAFGGNRGGEALGEGPGGGAPAGRGAGGRGAGGRGGGGRPVRLNREPASFTALAASAGDLGTRAAALLGRIEWPGKPGAAAAVTPLTPEEQRRFDAGRELYLSLCQACHQPDGRGREKLGANLVGATLALAPAHVTARIVIGGKEGPIGLMPPLGGSLTDNQIANALTYVRREWGNTATPVDAQTVKAAREASTGRTRPWTTDELMALIGGGRGGQH